MMKLEEILKFVSKIDRVSIHTIDDGLYYNYRFKRDVPTCWNDYYVYGFGMMESEEYEYWKDNANPEKIPLNRLPEGIKSEINLSQFLEIVISKEEIYR